MRGIIVDNNVLRLLYFIFLIPLNWLSFHWLWNVICKSAGVTKQEVWKARAEVRRQPSPHRYVIPWMMSRSPNPKKTKWLVSAYRFGIVPILLSINFAVMGLVTSVFDEILRWAAIVMPLIIAAAAAAGISYTIYRKRNFDDQPEKKETLTEQWKTFINLIREKEIEPYKETHKGSTGKLAITGIIKLVVVIGVMAGIFFLILNLSGDPKTPAASKQVWDVMVSQGYEPYDLTEKCRVAWSADSVLDKVIVIEKDDLRFEFSVFDSDKTALSLWQQYDTHIRNNIYSEPSVESKENRGNYRIYTLQVNKKYIVNIQVDNTVVYAYSNEENAHIIRDILISIGYFFEV